MFNALPNNQSIYLMLLLAVVVSQLILHCECNPRSRDRNENQCKSKGLVPVQKYSRKVESNGCSKPEFLQVEGEEDFTTCCDHHDACYATCGISKAYCEKEFEKCMKRMCKEVFSSNSRCEGAASTYAMGTSMFGDSGFQSSQNDYCDCVKPQDVYGHYEAAVSHFYDNFVTKEEEKKNPASVLAKYSKNSGTEDNPVYSELPNLYYSLLRKYDLSSIAHIGARKYNKNPPRVKSQSKTSKSDVKVEL